jgi:hypothetical protein
VTISGLSAACANQGTAGESGAYYNLEMTLQMSNTTSAWIKNDIVFGIADEDASE